MRYYSDETKMVYNTVEELDNAEVKARERKAAIEAERKREEEKKRRLESEKKERIDEVLNAYREADKLADKYFEDYGVGSLHPWDNFAEQIKNFWR